jgi:putative phage-type endonuclease
MTTTTTMTTPTTTTGSGGNSMDTGDRSNTPSPTKRACSFTYGRRLANAGGDVSASDSDKEEMSLSSPRFGVNSSTCSPLATPGRATKPTDTTLLEQGSVGWFNERAYRLTGSNIAAAVGLSPYATPHSFWEKITGKLGNTVHSSSSATHHGIAHEKDVVAMYTAQTGRQVVDTGFWVHPQHVWVGASPDGLVGDKGVLEIKCPIYKVHDHVPAYYMPQVQAEMACTEREWTDFCSCFISKFGTKHLRIFRVPRSVEYWAWLLPKMRTFWACVILDTSPRGIPALSVPPSTAPPAVAVSTLVDVVTATL